MTALLYDTDRHDIIWTSAGKNLAQKNAGTPRNLFSGKPKPSAGVAVARRAIEKRGTGNGE